jgi:WD40 repeat protein
VGQAFRFAAADQIYILMQYGTRIVSAAIDKTVRIWDVETGELFNVIALPDELFSAA